MNTQNTAFDDDLVLLDDSLEVSPQQSRWYILVVDDDDEIHSVTRYALTNFG